MKDIAHGGQGHVTDARLSQNGVWGSTSAATTIAASRATARLKEMAKRRYFAAEKRLSNELEDTIG